MTYVCCIVPYIHIAIVKRRENPWVLDGIGEERSGLITGYRYLFLAMLVRSNDCDRRRRTARAHENHRNLQLCYSTSAG